MRKLSLLTYSTYELKRIDINNSMKIMNMLYDAESNNVRLQAPLTTWLYLNNKSDLQAGPKIKKILNAMYEKYPKVSENNALDFLKNSSNKELNKFYNSFISENMRRDENEFKNKMRNLIRILKEEKNLSNYRICKLADVDIGNFHSFYELNKNDRLSKDALKQIVIAVTNEH